MYGFPFHLFAANSAKAFLDDINAVCKSKFVEDLRGLIPTNNKSAWVFAPIIGGNL